jgi:hypothetical protein
MILCAYLTTFGRLPNEFVFLSWYWFGVVFVTTIKTVAWERIICIDALKDFLRAVKSQYCPKVPPDKYIAGNRNLNHL